MVISEVVSVFGLYYCCIYFNESSLQILVHVYLFLFVPQEFKGIPVTAVALNTELDLSCLIAYGSNDGQVIIDSIAKTMVL